MSDGEVIAPVEHLVGERLVHQQHITLRRAIGSVGVANYEMMANITVPLGPLGQYVESLWLLREGQESVEEKAPRLHVLNEHAFNLVTEGMNVREATEKWRSYGEVGLMYHMCPVQIFRRGSLHTTPKGYEKPPVRPQVWVGIDRIGRVIFQDATQAGTTVMANWARAHTSRQALIPSVQGVDRHRHLWLISPSKSTS